MNIFGPLNLSQYALKSVFLVFEYCSLNVCVCVCVCVCECMCVRVCVCVTVTNTTKKDFLTNCPMRVD